MTEEGGTMSLPPEEEPPENDSESSDLLGAAKKLPPGKRGLKKQESTFFGRNSIMIGDTKV